MSVRCSKCGEELLGAVNRCWKCGQQFAAQPDMDGLPPVRQTFPPTPVAAAASAPLAALDPAAVQDQGDVVVAELSRPQEALQVSSDPAAPAAYTSQPGAPGSARPIRTGSPFVAGARMVPVTVASATSHPLMGRPMATPSPHDPVAVAGAIASILLGVFALSIAWIKAPVAIIGAAVIAIIGFGMGIWGLYSKRRGWALVGILISCLVIGLASYGGSIMVYESMRESQAIEGTGAIDE